MVSPRRLLLLALVVGSAAAGCTHDPDELMEDVNTTIFVVGVEEREQAQIEVAGETRRASPELDGDGDGDDDGQGGDVVIFRLWLPVGEHEGRVVILAGDGDGLEPRRCGSFEVVLANERSSDTAVVDAEDLEECDDEPAEGEGEGEGEGEDGDQTPPEMESPAEQRVLVGGQAQVTLAATDDVSAAERLVFSIERAPAHGSATLTGDVLSYQASATSEENDVVLVSVSDEAGNTRSGVDVRFEVQAFDSCQGILASGLADDDGSYLLRVDDQPSEDDGFVAHHCLFAGGEGWTLVLKGPGDDARIALGTDWQSAPIDDGGGATATAAGYALFPAFLAAPVSEVQVFFNSVDTSSGVRFSILPTAASQPWASLAEAFDSAQSVTRDGPDGQTWQDAVGVSSFLFEGCAVSGLNASVAGAEDNGVLLGIVTTDQADCTGDARVVGVGLAGDDGTFAGAHGDGLDQQAYAFVYVR